MPKHFLFAICSLCFSVVACNLACGGTQNSAAAAHAVTDTTKYGALDTATFASGCFWCVEAIFESLRGVQSAESGYSGGKTQNPTYEEVCSHTTGHTETVQIYYDPTMISYQTLLEVYFGSCDPTQANGQGPDHGDSYRSVIFFRNDTERDAAESMKAKLNASSRFIKRIAVDIMPLERFWLAEQYHQDYERLHPENSYVRNVSVPRLNRMKKVFPALLKAE
jgi:peptide-methionine (S)-S-oxide reductase